MLVDGSPRSLKLLNVMIYVPNWDTRKKMLSLSTESWNRKSMPQGFMHVGMANSQNPLQLLLQKIVQT